MKSIVMGRVKKWVILALIGCFAYFVGFIWGQGSHKDPATTTPEIQNTN